MRKEKKKRKNTWITFSTSSSQTNEAIKKCETSAVQSARLNSIVHRHNSGYRVAEVGMVGTWLVQWRKPDLSSDEWAMENGNRGIGV